MIVTEDGRHTLYGRSTTTGRHLWSRRLAHGCLLPETLPYASGSSDRVAAFDLDCGARERVLALDPRTGHTLFTVNSAHKAAHAAVWVGDDVTAIFDGSGLSAFDRTGRRFLLRAGADVCRDMCPTAVTGGHLLVAYGPASRDEDATSTRSLESIEITSGAVTWQRDMPGYTALSVAGGLLYGLRSHLADPLLPAGIDVIDPATGGGTTVPAPMVVRPGLDGVHPWLSAGGGLLYVALPAARPRPFGGAKLMALRGGIRGLGPPELAGVPTGDWPDACSLLTKHDLPRGYFGSPSPANIDGLRLPVACTYRPRRHGPDGPQRETGALSVTVQWVATDTNAASALFTAARDTQSSTHDPVKVGDAAYAVGVPSGTVTMRVGRTIVTVTSGVPGTATRMAAAVADHLRKA